MMLPDEWTRIEALFDQVGEMGPAERESFLERCDESAEVVQKVRDLLASDEAATELGFLSPVLSPDGASQSGSAAEPGFSQSGRSSSRSSVSQTGGSQTDADPLPERFGPYRVVEQIGRGGMGVVYLAERDDGAFEQTVAIKRVGGVAGPRRQAQALARFSRERQILADLSHPHIARLLDGGTAENGEPYLVMEWIDGVPIDLYCKQEQLSARQRLRLLAVVCEAVQAAHQRLIVHRDIKPSNVLVDKDGQVKLLDFGIATLLDESGEGAMTVTGGRLLTPQYASPEQLRGESVGVATDVYQLGLLAYELLTDKRPYELSSVAPAEAMRLVLQEPPPPPSTVSSELDREIDALVGKSLDKEPQRRYASADRLREDVESYLGGLPISARPATLGYQLGKFIRRHALFFTFAASALVLMAVMATFFTVRLIAERNQKEAEAQRAERLRQESESVIDFLIDLFEVSDPDTSLGETITARELLDRGAADLEEGLEDQPLVQARLMSTIARIYGRLGLYGDSTGLFERAVELHEVGAEPLDLAASLRGLAGVWMRTGELDKAGQALERARELLEGAADADDPVRGQLLHEIGYLNERKGRFELAEQHFREALAIFESTSADPRQVADLLDSLGSVVSSLGRQEEALTHLQRGLELREGVWDDDHPEVAKSLSNVATLMAQQGRYAEAEPLLDRTFQVMTAAYGEEHLQTSRARINLGIIHMELGRFDEAEMAFEQSARWIEKHLGPKSMPLAQAHMSLGNLALKRKAPEKAVDSYRQFLGIIEAVAGAQHPMYAQGLSNIGEAQFMAGETEEAEVSFRRALEGLEAALASDHPSLSWPVLGLAQCLDRRGQVEEAGELFRRAVALREKSHAPGSIERLEAEQLLAAFEQRRAGTG